MINQKSKKLIINKFIYTNDSFILYFKLFQWIICCILGLNQILMINKFSLLKYSIVWSAVRHVHCKNEKKYLCIIWNDISSIWLFIWTMWNNIFKNVLFHITFVCLISYPVSIYLYCTYYRIDYLPIYVPGVEIGELEIYNNIFLKIHLVMLKENCNFHVNFVPSLIYTYW